jgi:predicted DNA-binding helix-hairpin-helix protein
MHAWAAGARKYFSGLLRPAKSLRAFSDLRSSRLSRYNHGQAQRSGKDFAEKAQFQRLYSFENHPRREQLGNRGLACLADAVSLNIETPGAENLAKLSSKKRYIEDIIEPIKLISRLTAPGARYHRVRQTTQFIVGAAGEQDSQIVRYMFGLYDRLKMHRVYFSAYQRDLGELSVPAEPTTADRPADILMREHRLYQVDFLLRRYGFTESDIVFERDGNLSLATDPKEIWALQHPETFPVNINKAPYLSLLKVPGLGPITVKRILELRKQGRLTSIRELGNVGVRLKKSQKYLSF